MLRLLSLLCVLALIIPACSEDSTTSPDGTTSSNNSFTVNGAGYSNAAFSGYSGDTAGVAQESAGAGAVIFSGKTPNANEYFAMTLLVKSTAVGGYQVNISEGTNMTLTVMVGSSTKTYFAGTGSIDITTWGTSGRATGKFSGSFVDPANPSATPLQITAGKFNVAIEN